MRDFEYYAPTRIIFGKDTHYQIGQLLKEKKCRKSNKKSLQNLRIPKNSSTFAPAFERESNQLPSVLSSSGLGQRPLTP